MHTLSVNKTLIINYFAGNASPMQKRLIKEWLATEENQELYFEWLVEWQSHSPQYLLNGEKRFEEFVKFMEENAPVSTENSAEKQIDQTMIKKPFLNIFTKKQWMIAASFFVLCSVAWFSRDRVYFKKFETAFGETQTVYLEDGTKVILNANSSMVVPRFGFGEKIREVTLDGEAFFVVKHTTDNKKFLVKTSENFQVLVLGTEFSVYTRSKGSKVLLKKGKVRIRFGEGNKSKELVMKPGDLITMDKLASSPVLKSHADTNRLMAWTDNRFVFDKMPLSEVTDLIKEHFGITVEIQDSKFANRTVSGTFQPESAEELLSLLGEMFDFKIEHEGEKIIITSK